MARSLGGQLDALMRALRSFEPGEFSGADCARLVTKFARAEKALAAARTRAAARAADCNEHRKEGFADPSEWLSRHTGSTARDAKEHLNTLKQLEGLPETRDAVTSGQVSLDQAGEIARTEAEAPGSEAELLDLAKTSGLSKLRDEAREKRANAGSPDDLHKRQRAARSVRHWRDGLGMIAGTFRLTPDVGVPFVSRLEREAQRNRTAAKQRGDVPERFDADAADAFADIIGKRPTTARKTKGREVDVVVVCDLDAYRRGHSHGDEGVTSW